ncbi:MAG: hypothetical protein LBR42_01505 [Candidatus Methanoplasma sp.]|jgi:hypothetical protein|nr:hypothetical protein [Candidatus Methanoplasma sp.]
MNVDDYNEIPRNPLWYGVLSMACGVIGTVIVFTLSEQAMISVILGAIGMLVGGFAINLSNHFPTNARTSFMGIAGVGIMTSVISFMFGLAQWVG